MRVLITGNMGYVGPMVVAHLRERFPDWELVGFDSGFFAGCLVAPLLLPERVLDEQIFGDVRRFPEHVLKGVDAVVHLAAISNDPMGKAYEAATKDVNYEATIGIARAAKRAGIQRFVFASSCSVYGAGGADSKSEGSSLDPLTEYARSKTESERGLLSLADQDFVVSCLRFATACGFAPRLRLDLVLNDFVASAIATGKIMILSDGRPWRPLIDVRDMARAMEWAIIRPQDAGGHYLVINCGASAGNYQVKDLAAAVREQLPQVEVEISANAQPDNRSYRVDFGLFARLAPDHQPLCALKNSVQGLVAGLEAMCFKNTDFRQSDFVRLNVLRKLQEAGFLTRDLTWRTHN